MQTSTKKCITADPHSIVCKERYVMASLWHSGADQKELEVQKREKHAKNKELTGGLVPAAACYRLQLALVLPQADAGQVGGIAVARNVT